MIANRVRSPDGRWLALDARTIKVDQRTLSALYHAGLRAELTARIGVAWDVPVHGIAEIVDIPEVLRVEFSQRTGAVQRRVDEKLDRFTEAMGREPTVRERWQLEREAVLDSRPAKPKALDANLQHRRWADQTVTLGLDPADVVAQAVGHPIPAQLIDRWSGTAIADQAMATITEGQSSWRPAELVRELAAAVPTATSLAAEQLVGWLDDVASGVAVSRCVDLSRSVPPGALLRRDGRPVTESAVDRALTEPGPARVGRVLPVRELGSPVRQDQGLRADAPRAGRGQTPPPSPWLRVVGGGVPVTQPVRPDPPRWDRCRPQTQPGLAGKTECRR